MKLKLILFVVCLATGVVMFATQDSGARATKCSLDPLKDCTLCTTCTDTKDNCCCRHVDRCPCELPTAAGKTCKKK